MKRLLLWDHAIERDWMMGRCENFKSNINYINSHMNNKCKTKHSWYTMCFQIYGRIISEKQEFSIEKL